MRNQPAGSLYPAEPIDATRAPSRSDHVRLVFENAPRYLSSRGVDIRFRIETIRDYAARLQWASLLDIGCGDGSLSLQLVTPDTTATLMDLSSAMAAMATSNIPHGLDANVEVRNEDFAIAEFRSKRYDLIIAVGVMAHVDSPDAFLQKLKGLLKPQGNVVLEFTDARHIVGRIGRLWGWVKEILAPAQYPTNKLSYAEVATLLEHHDLKIVATFRYSRVPLPAFNRVFGHPSEFRLLQRCFGNCNDNRNARFGNEYIFLLESK
jgi:SAM-dependent methyltransferase